MRGSGGVGGASSSKKVQMEQPMSKGTAGNMMSGMIQRGIEREMIVRRFGPEEDVVESPEVTPRESENGSP